MIWRATLAIAVGLLLGGAAARLETQSCVRPETTDATCLTETPQVRVVNGMVSGAFASGGALVLIELWGRFQDLDS